MTRMVRAWRASRKILLFVLVTLLGVATQHVLSRQSVVQGGTRQTKIIGRERLVSVQQLPELEGPMCPEGTDPDLMASLQRPPALMAALPQQRPGTAGAADATPPPLPSEAVKSDIAKRHPISTLRDPRNVFSGLFIDTFRNEVVIAEENNFSVLVYDRTENTPPGAALSEPKRMISGERTYLEYGCGVYVDPETGEIYVINNDTLNWMPVFNRSAKGNITPNRRLATPYSTFGLVGDEDTQELLMTIQEDNAVLTFKKTARHRVG
jgi:hypothetical protein